MSKSGKIMCAVLVLLTFPAGLAAAELSISRGPGGEARQVTLYAEAASNYVDLGELSAALETGLRWERTGERIVLTVGQVEFAFEDLLTFFSAGGQTFQLVAPCLLLRGTFLVPVQFVSEYLPRLMPGRFEFDKPAGRLVDRGANASGPAEEKSVASPPATRTPESSRKQVNNYRIKTVMIDPGHGGKDPGATGTRYHLREKDTVLDISRRVAAKLNNSGQGLTVLVTRDNDTFVPLQKRGQTANMESAGLFVSIHCNAHRKSSVRGTSTYFLDAAKTDEERATAMLENAALKHEVEDSGREGGDEVNLILQDMAQNEFLRESKDLSAYIHRELVKVLDLPDRGIKQANFAVLRGAYMPAALIETAYITNPKDELLLRDSSFRDHLAGAIADGILKYIEHYHRKLTSGN